MRLSSALVALSLIATSLDSASAATAVAKTTAYLVRPAFSPPDADAKGVIKMKRMFYTGADVLDIRAENLNPAGAYSVELESGYSTGSYLFIGYMTFEPGVARHRCLFRAMVEGLPLGASTLDDYVGRRLRIVDLGTASTVLNTVMPFVMNGTMTWIKTDTSLTHSPSGLDPFAFGRVVSAWRTGDLRQKLTITAYNLDPSVNYHVEMLTPILGGVYLTIGELFPSFGDPTRKTLKIDTATGAPLPLGTPGILDVSGRTIRVVDQYGFVILEGTMP